MHRAALVLVTFLFISPLGFATPLIRTGGFSLSADGTNIRSVPDCIAGRVVIASFSAELSAIDFYIVHEDDWDLSGTPDIGDCEFYISAQSATHQFVLNRNGTWYMFFKNGPQPQDVQWSWDEYSQETWGFRQLMTWTLVSVGIIGGLLVILWYWRSRA